MLFPLGSMPNAPQFETRKALLVIDLQNDFLQEDGKLFVNNVKEFVPKLPSLVAKFREEGEVFWATTEFQDPRPTICAELGSYRIVLEDFLETTKSSETNVALDPAQLEDNYKHLPDDDGNDDPEAFLAQRCKMNWPRCCQPATHGCAIPKAVACMIDHKKDSMIVKSDYSVFQARSLLPTLRMKLITQLYLCGALSNISVYATALDAVRHGLEVTIIEDCVGYRNGKCHEEAMRQMADRMGVNGTDYQELMDDLCGNLGDVVTATTFKSTLGTRRVLDGDATHEEYATRVNIKRWMDDVNDGKSMDVDHCNQGRTDGFKAGSAKRRSLSTRTDLSNSRTGDLENISPCVHAPQKRSNDKIDSEDPAKRASHPLQDAKTSRVRVRRSRMVSEADGANDRSALQATEAQEALELLHEEKQVSSPTHPAIIEPDPDADGTLLNEMSSLVDKAKAFGRNLRGSKQSKHSSSSKVLGPGDFIGQRDSRIIYDFLPPMENLSDAFVKLRKEGDSSEVRWQEMYHRSGKVPRLVAVQGGSRQDGYIPIYRHPADESPALLPFSSTIQSIREEVEKTVGHPVNHVLIQLYRGGEDNISEHSDKTLDIVQGSFIVNVSLGAMRTMTLRMKKSASSTQRLDQPRRASAPASISPIDVDVTRTTQRIPLPHNSLFVLGQATNQIWLHAIRADKRPKSKKTAEELAFDEDRISLTFRQIGTFINPKDGTIWGQGATSKSVEDARVIIEGPEAEKEGERLIRAFGKENHQSHDFDWQGQYGAGFDVVNFATNIASQQDRSSDIQQV